MWYLSQDGQQHGPYPLEQLASMILEGRVSTGFVGLQGEQQWTPLERHPTFGPMLARATGRSSVPNRTAPASHDEIRRRWVIASIVGAALLCFMVAAVAHRLIEGSAGSLATLVPGDVDVYVELDDIPNALEAMAELGFIDQERLDTEQALDELVEALQGSFEVDEDTARDVLESVESVALALRDPAGRAEHVTLVRLSAAGDLEDLLESERFKAEGEVGDGALRYSIWPDDTPPEDRSRWSKLRSMLSRMEIERGSSERTLMWFPTRHLLAFGSANLVADIVDVLDGKQEALADTDAWTSAQFTSRAQGIGYFDPTVLRDDPEGIELARAIFDDVGPTTWSLRIEEAGLVSTLRGQLRGAALPATSLPEPMELALFRRLPTSTVAYVTVSHPSQDPVRPILEDMAIPVISRDFGPSAKWTREMLQPLWELVGDELVLALLCSDEFRLDPHRSREAALRHVAVGLVLRIEDHPMLEMYEQMLENSTQSLPSLFDGYRTSKSGNELHLTPNDPNRPWVRVALLDDHVLVMAAGEKELVRGFIGAARGDEPHLGDEAAHTRALEALSLEARAHTWIDASRLVRALPSDAFDGTALSSPLARELGLSPRLLVLDGEERLTIAAALELGTEGDAWRYQLRMLNIGDPLTMSSLGPLSTVAQQLHAAFQTHLRWTPPPPRPQGIAPSFW